MFIGRGRFVLLCVVVRLFFPRLEGGVLEGSRIQTTVAALQEVNSGLNERDRRKQRWETKPVMSNFSLQLERMRLSGSGQWTFRHKGTKLTSSSSRHKKYYLIFSNSKWHC